MSNESPIDKDWHNSDYEIKEQDRFLPIANVGRVMKKALPERAKLSKESKECVQECVSEFISFITSQAADKCKLEKRKTLNGEDILWAMYTLGFENYSETLKIYLAKYRQQEQALIKPPRRKNYKKKKAKSKKETSEEEETQDEYQDEFNDEDNLLNPEEYFQETNLNDDESGYPVPTAATTFPIGNEYFQQQGIESEDTTNIQYLNQPNIDPPQQQAFPQTYAQPTQPQQLSTQSQPLPDQLYTPQEQVYNMNDTSDVQMQLNQQGQGVGIILRSSSQYSRTDQDHRSG
ncbi:hypothetical protein I9W82_003654 [Candida metapsilosis]|uniref:Transcription factor CBF/NF-Y/archaeal histone domain-containing protein n=1 Tax=Candida metapsilosis TaxID=273372 RepID=A0A8H7ZHI8_9ASCO|nr:hypothetical protein I9W82_003654 [Candida metapsilosis]